MKYLIALLATVFLAFPAMAGNVLCEVNQSLDDYISVIKQDKSVNGAAIILPGPSREAFSNSLKDLMGPMPEHVQYLVVLSHVDPMEPKSVEKMASFNANKECVGNSQTYHLLVQKALAAAVQAAGDGGIQTPSDEKVAPIAEPSDANQPLDL